ncbi:MAG TPA: alpha/beta fold hydrolase [Hypericibacter adhaerens]|uniref:alpha/beta hydrolase n=1 Tax=Hypericibacter adhaerens TaxID=2602016 RepID=UPI002BCAE93E|nr:alpha/beta fold hydrolase [Hypericibacter adhaerens]HWA44288.1 alpha/beta fold hydrolase [Hypericibacter adhaerens]
MPDGSDPVPAVLILAGSGPVDRDGNLPGARNDSLKLLAQGLAERGIAALRIDKRGIGESRAAGIREEDLRVETYVADAVGWLDLLHAYRRIERLSLLGHSEGALVATLAAQQATVAGLILIAGAGEPAARLIERQLSAAGVPADLQAASRRIVDELERGRPVPEVPPALAALYRPSVQNYLMSWLPLDPARELAKTALPVLVIQGTADLQASVEDARRLAAARPDGELRLIEGMNHVLKDAPAERLPNLAIYDRPELPLSASLVPAIADFLDDR